jgi:hypothetical protein
MPNRVAVWVQVSGAVAAVPALIIWSWGLFVAVIGLTQPTGRAVLCVSSHVWSNAKIVGLLDHAEKSRLRNRLAFSV